MIYKVTFPRPILYRFGPDGLADFNWVKDYDRKHGRHASNQHPEIISCTALDFDRNEHGLSVTTNNNLSIGGIILIQIALHFADRHKTKSFDTLRDLKLLFETPSNPFNDANDWWDRVGTDLILGTPLEEIDAATPMGMYSESRYEVDKERNRNLEFWTRLRPSEIKDNRRRRNS
ncbi:hypothetical protein IVB41_21925 [Bradyrhizobium sp. 44]|uniref:hypothetical protein n=1 Tax=Bradyrhizobium sp. 44 TaxID=2782675 RepID=UPI001FF713F4|nr:hypothetical protein [Bradyrhizobium sp. 44]MCK1286583.1 hypothetical protein [Bradyrhizobium sp. 44]